MDKRKIDRTNKERQLRRRQKEKLWLKEQGWNSWEALHTALVRGELLLNLDSEKNDQCSNLKKYKSHTT